MHRIDLEAFARFNACEKFAAANRVAHRLCDRDDAAGELTANFGTGRWRQLDSAIEFAPLADRRRSDDGGLDAAGLGGVGRDPRAVLRFGLFPAVAVAASPRHAFHIEPVRFGTDTLPSPAPSPPA